MSLWHGLTKSLLTRKVVQSEGKYSWTPTPVFLNSLLEFLRSKYPEGSLRVHQSYEQQTRSGPVELETSIDGVGVRPSADAAGLITQDIHVNFRRHIDPKGTFAIHVFGKRGPELKNYILEFLKDQIARVKAKETGRNLRAFTTPGVQEKLNTLPPGISSEIVGYITGNTKEPTEKVEELKTFVSRPYGGRRKTRARRRKNRKTRKL